MMNKPTPPFEQAELSSSGRARSEEILGELQGQLGRAVARDRRVRRSAALCTVLAVAAVSAWAVWPRSAAVSPLPAPQVVRGGNFTPERTGVQTPGPAGLPHGLPEPAHRAYVRVVSTRQDVLAACQSRPAGASPTACVLSDKQLLSALAETGSNFGLVRVNGRTVVIKDGQPMPDQGG